MTVLPEPVYLLHYSMRGRSGSLKQNPLWVGSDCEDCDFLLVRSVEPKNTVRRWGPILGIRLEDFFAVGAGKGVEFMGFQTRVSGIVFKKRECFSYCFELFPMGSACL